MTESEASRPQVLAAEPKRRHRSFDERSGNVAADPWKGLGVLGVALAVVGGVDIGLLWWPPKFGDPNWEFVIITNFLDALPVATVGVTLVALSALGRSWSVIEYLLIAASTLIVLIILALAVVYLLDIPLALRSTPAEMRSVVYRSMFKTGAFATTYVAYFAWLGWFLWRRARLAKN